MLARESETVKVGLEALECFSPSGINGNPPQGSLGQRLAQRSF